jgi:hypothetical protein
MQGMKVYNFKNLLVIKKVITKGTILKQGYEISLNAFQVSGISIRDGVIYS